MLAVFRQGKELFMELLPALLDLSDKAVLVIGNGPDTFQLLRYLIRFSNNLTLLSPSVTEQEKDLCSSLNIRVIEAPYNRESFHGMDYVFNTSISPEVIKDTAAICRTMGITLFTGGHPGKSDFALNISDEDGLLER